MNGIDSMLDIEQLRLSITESSIPTAIAQVHQWIDVNGTAMIKSNQRLPYSFKEAEELRKLHEKIELKCMNFLAFYAHMNLKTIPEDCEPMRQNMDIAIHNFSERVKARRHVVVSFFTFYRHLDELTDTFKGIREEDHIHLPDTLSDVQDVIEKYHNTTNLCLKKFSHLKEEAIRVKASLDMLLKLDNDLSTQIVDPALIKKVIKYLDELMNQTELELTSCYENQHLMEMEVKIESKMMFIEEEIMRSTSWMQIILDAIISRYNDTVVGKATVENDILQEQNKDYVKNLQMAHEYGTRLQDLYKKFCDQFDRETDRGDSVSDKFDELWNTAEIVSAESTERLKIASNLFHNLDSTLEIVEDLLMAINKDRENIEKKDSIFDHYQAKIYDVHGDYQNIKKIATHLFQKLQFDLMNKRLLPKSSCSAEIEQIEDMVKMKIFTLSVKIKALDRCLHNDEVPLIQTLAATKERSALDATDYDNAGIFDIIKKYLAFLNSSLSNWESKPLPKTLDQARKSIDAHKKLSGQSEDYWKDIQNTLSQYFGNSAKAIQSKEVKSMLSDAENQKRKWDKKWSSHLKRKLDPRLQLLLKIQSFNDVLGENMSTLDEFVTRPNHSLPLVIELKEELGRMTIDPKWDKLKQLKNEAQSIHESDFDNPLNSLEAKLNSYNNRLNNFLQLESIIEEIHEFLPKLTSFKSEWHSRVNMHRDNPVEMAELKDEAKQIHARIDEFDIEQFRKLATAIYGSSKRVEWLIDELVVDFRIPKQHRTISATHKAIENPIIPAKQAQVRTEKSETPNKNIESNGKLLLVNAESSCPTRLDFVLESLPRIDKDQYDIQWYKDNEAILPDCDPRILLQCNSQSGKMKMHIDNCRESDAGQYWCEVRNGPSVIRKSSPVLLSVFSQKQGTVIPKFSEKTFAANTEPLSLKLVLDGFKYAPESDLIFNNMPINVNHSSCPWSKVSSNEMIQFNHRSVSLKDVGQYLFRVSSKDVAKTHLEIGEKPEFVYHQFKENSLLGDSLAISIPMKNFHKMSPKTIIWKKNKTPLTANKLSHKTYINDNGELVFEIPKFTQAHVGDYTCQVSNEFGEDVLKLQLSAAEALISSQTLIPVSAKPISSSQLSDNYVTGKVGDSIKLDFEFPADVSSDVVWLKDNQPLNSRDPRIQIYYPEESKCSLKINGATVNDSGTYQAVLKETGQTQTTIVEINPIQFAPVIQDFPQSIRAKQNGSINIVCVVNSYPSCHSINWSIKPADGSPTRNLVNNARYKMINKPLNKLTGNMQRIELYFDNVTTSDGGEYCLRVENSAGWSSVMIPITVADENEFESNESDNDMIVEFEFEMEETDQEISTIEDLNKKDEILNPFTKLCQDFSCLQTNLDDDDSLNMSSVLDLIDIYDSQYGDECQIQFDKNPLRYSSYRGDEKVTELYTSELVDENSSSSVLAEAQNKKTSPKFIQKLDKEIISPINEKVIVRCKVSGNPNPILKWMKNGEELSESDHLMIRKVGETHELVIKNCKKSDAGIYEAQASNTNGSEVSKCHLQVIDPTGSVNTTKPPEKPISFTIIPTERYQPADDNSDIGSPQRTQMIFSNTIVRSPPQFVTTFTDEIVKEGDDVVLKCCLIGYPEPLIWWSYNTHFINNPRFEMKRELDEYFLILKNIQKGDSGRYSITAENSSGLATCSALVIVDSHNKNHSIDRSQYPSNSRPLPPETYSNLVKTHINDESRVMQASPRGWQEFQFHSNASTLRSSKNDIFEQELPVDKDVSTTKTKTIKTYHYSGPSGVNLPGVGFIPKISQSANNSSVSSSSSSSSSSKSHVGVAKFVSGDKKPNEFPKFVPFPCDEDPSRFSVVESSECDFPL